MTAPLIRVLAAIVLILCPALALAQPARVIATVNGRPITELDLNERIVFAIKSIELQDTPEMHLRLAPQILRQMIDEKLQIQNADSMGLQTSEAEINGRVGEIERAGARPPGSFRAYLKSIGVSFEIATQQIKASLAWGKIVRRRVRPTVDVSDTEIDDALNRMKANIGKTEARVAEIFIPIDRPEQAEDARKATERLLDQLKRGAPFAGVAQQFSQGAAAQNGGDLGWVLPGSLDPTLDAAIEKLPLRQPSELIRTPAGWHILYVVDRRPFATARPDDVHLVLVQMTLALPVNASPDEVNRATADAQKAMAAVHQCADLHAQARQLKGATVGDLPAIRVGDLFNNEQMYAEIPKLAVGGVAGPFRVLDGLQIVSLCSKEDGGANGGLPSREAVKQLILLQKLEAAARRYMRDMRRSATIEIIKQP